MSGPAGRTLGVGVIGVGGVAQSHFPGWQASPRAEVVALADLDPTVLALAGKAQGVGAGHCYANALDLIRDPNVDIVDICTPNMYHAPLAVAALEAGKHVLCEKPLAPTPEAIREMMAARDRSGRLLMTAQNFRWAPSARALKAAVDGGALGEVYHARAWMLRRSAFLSRPGFVQKRHSGGGACIDIGVHILDLALWMMGHPRPMAVSGVTQTRLARQPGAFSIWEPPGTAMPESLDVEEFAAAMVRFASGATLMLEVSWLLHHKTENEDMQLWLYGEQGGAHWPSNELLSTDFAARQHLDTRLALGRGEAKTHALECMAFGEAVAEGRPSPVPAEQSLDVLTVLDGLYRSAALGREVALDAG